MNGDVKIDGDWVILEGNWARLRTWDLMLDAPDRRTSAAGVRRAMVHAMGDRLILNYARDYIMPSPVMVPILDERRLFAFPGSRSACWRSLPTRPNRRLPGFTALHRPASGPTSPKGR